MKKYIKLIILILVVAIIIFIFLFSCSKKEKGKEEVALEFKDKAFANMIKKELNKDEIYASDLSEISGIMIAADRVLGFSGGGHTDKSIILFGFDSFLFSPYHLARTR